MKKFTVEVLDETSNVIFKNKCEDLLNDGYKMKSSSCGFVQSDEYDFCTSFQAIFVKEAE